MWLTAHRPPLESKEKGLSVYLKGPICSLTALRYEVSKMTPAYNNFLDNPNFRSYSNSRNSLNPKGSLLWCLKVILVVAALIGYFEMARETDRLLQERELHLRELESLQNSLVGLQSSLDTRDMFIEYNTTLGIHSLVESDF